MQCEHKRIKCVNCRFVCMDCGQEIEQPKEPEKKQETKKRRRGEGK
jgi:hypothetical protein